jgi:hypothetical protein
MFMECGIRNVSYFYSKICQTCFNEILRLPGFVNAQYRFVMNPIGDYTVHFADPDMQVSTLICLIFDSNRLR